MNKNALIVFLLIGFGVPWVGWTVADIFEFSPAIEMIIFYVGDFCSIGGLVAVFVASGKDGFLRLINRLFVVNFPIRWWFISFLIPFLYVGFAYGLGSYLSEEVVNIELSNFWGMFSTGALMLFLTGPIGEEFGWRGFLLPELFIKYSALKATLIVGIVWSIWHYPLYYDGIFSSVYMSLLFTITLITTSMIMTIIMLHTKGNMLIAIIYHWLINVLPITFSRVLVDDALNFTVLQILGKIIIVILLLLYIGEKPIQQLNEKARQFSLS